MTNLNTANIGHNKYCGPAVLSILTGKSTDECAAVIGRVNGQYNIKGVLTTDLLKAADKLGYDSQEFTAANSLYGTLVKLSRSEGMYIISLETHFVTIEVTPNQIYFCDNHTKEPIPAAASARMMQKVVRVHKVFKRAEPEYIPPNPIPKPFRNQPLIEAIQLLRRLCRNGCWCEIGIGNPMYKEHTQTCKDVQDFLNGRI